MGNHRNSAGRWPSVGRLAGAVIATALVVAANSGPIRAQGTTPATIITAENQSLNDALYIERIAAEFFSQNASKGYLGGATEPASSGTKLTVALSGGEQIPPVTSTATGTASFTLGDDRTLAYDVQVTGLSGPANAMHLQRGKKGEEGQSAYPLNTPDASGRSTGTTQITAEDVAPLKNGELYLNVSTAANPEGEIRGQVVLAATDPAVPSTPASAAVSALRKMGLEARDNHLAHVAALEQRLGTNAQPAPTFRSEALQAPTLTQFITTAIAIEDAAASSLQGAILFAHQSWQTAPASTLPGTSIPPEQDNITLLVGMALVDAVHLGGFRGWRLQASTAEGGDPNMVLVEEGPLKTARNRAQLREFAQQYATTPVGGPGIASVTFSATNFAGGTAPTGTITLNGPAPVGGVIVTLSSSNISVATVPATVTIPEGQTSVTFPVTSFAGVGGSATISASIAGGTATTIPLTVT